MPLFDLTDFFKLSSALNYNLSAATLNRYNVLRYITDNKRLDDDETKDREKRSIVMEALGYLFSAYRQKRRHLGPMAVLHPLRAAALYTRTRPSLDLVELLTLLFHDILEDVKPGQFSVQEWSAMEEQFYGLFGKMPPEDETRLTENMLSMTRRDNETYYQYVARLVENSHNSSEIVEIKLADRLDNTLDLRIDLEDSLSGIDFFENIFQIMFVNNYKGYVPKVEHAPASAINGAKRLYQLFKNAVLLSLIRLYAPDGGQWSQKLLFDAVAEAGLNEAQRTLMHLISYHVRDVSTQRGLLLEVMQYCYSGRSNLVTKPDGSQLLDGLFSTYFGHKSSQIRRQQLAILYQNKNLMMEAAVGFIVIFLNFLNDEKYYIQGISAEGIEPR
ncbi:MAG: hypothetical protein V2I56_21230 [Desulfobacteraceae bacterium]|jgi:hypothetical protein|nr:hypothetical protein [Desulfobacteraceae bacterium]